MGLRLKGEEMHSKGEQRLENGSTIRVKCNRKSEVMNITFGLYIVGSVTTLRSLVTPLFWVQNVFVVY